MKSLFVRMMLFAVASVLPSIGCQTCMKPCASPQFPPPVYGSGAFIVPPVDRSVPAGPVFAGQSVPQNGLAQAAAPESHNFTPPAAPAQPIWGPATNGGARLLAPEIGTGEPPLNTLKPAVPEVKEPQMPKVPENKNSAAVPALPAEIPGFLPVTEGLASGQQPFSGGFEWLKQNGYRAAVYIHEPGEDDSADKRRVEEAGLSYLAVEFSAKKIGQPVVDEFNGIVADSKNRPLFVYDRNGALAGGLWYLHFRTVGKLTDDAARARAATFGLKADKDNLDQPLWLAIQKYMSDLQP